MFAGSLCALDRSCFIILYADDILFNSSNCVKIRKSILHMCERELQWLDGIINIKKFCCCLRIGPYQCSVGSVIRNAVLTRSRLFNTIQFISVAG